MVVPEREQRVRMRAALKQRHSPRVLLQARKQAEDAIKTQSQRPEIVPHLLHLLQQSPDPQVRHLAALLLRKRISRHWKHLPAEVRATKVSV